MGDDDSKKKALEGKLKEIKEKQKQRLQNLKKIVEEFSENYQTSRDSVPNELEKELYSLTGIIQDVDPHCLLKIPIDSPHLRHIGSALGKFANNMFSDESLIDFLKEKGVEYILGIILRPESNSHYAMGTIPLNSIALPIKGEDAETFVTEAEKAGGSFRYEPSKVEGWSLYESE